VPEQRSLYEELAGVEFLLILDKEEMLIVRLTCSVEKLIVDYSLCSSTLLTKGI